MDYEKIPIYSKILEMLSDMIDDSDKEDMERIEENLKKVFREFYVPASAKLTGLQKFHEEQLDAVTAKALRSPDLKMTKKGEPNKKSLNSIVNKQIKELWSALPAIEKKKYE